LGGISRATAALGVSLALVACQRSRSPDTNLLTGRCTNREHSRAAAPRVPAAPTPLAGFGAIVGVLADSGGALPQYPVRAELIGGDRNSPHATATPDSLGGFVFPSLPTGRYRLYARAYSHRPDSAEVAIESGRVDTVRMVLQFFECVR
jgi:hypothetical protein